MKYKNLELIGTSHIAKQSIKDVEEAIIDKEADIVAIELDPNRVNALMSKKRRKAKLSDIRHIGFKGYLFSKIGAWAENKLGKSVGVKPGAEMKHAITLCMKKHLKMYMIDQDISVTLNKISKRLTWKEKWNFFVDAFKSFILRKQEVSFDLNKVPDEKTIKKLISKVKKRYPNMYAILVKERNEIMAKNIAEIMIRHPEERIVAIIGAGHEKEIMTIVKKDFKKKLEKKKKKEKEEKKKSGQKKKRNQIDISQLSNSTGDDTYHDNIEYHMTVQ